MNTMGRESRSCRSLSLRMRRAMKWGKPNALWSMAKIARAFRQAGALLALIGSPVVSLAQQPLSNANVFNSTIVTGAERTSFYLPLLQGKRIAVITNQTGIIGHAHLVDSLLALKVNVVKVFAPEHGFRGTADAGEHVKDVRDLRTGLPVISLYGSNKKPTPEQLRDVDLLLFDIQDVGVRFYTFISTLHYVMEAAAEEHKSLIVLDRPDPNGYFVDGPVLDTAYASFVGMHPVPLVHGMTIGEYAMMINGEEWLKGKATCDLKVIPCVGYDHASFYELPVKPSPNLPDMSSVYLYPSIGMFEGTIVSVGRGTDQPFQCIGFPGCTIGSFEFTPRSKEGAKDPPYHDRKCHGMDLKEYGAFYTRLAPQVHLHWLIGFYQAALDKTKFFNPFFDDLAGGPSLREAIVRGDDEDHIHASWQPAIRAFRKIRAKYLLYDDFK